MKLHSVLQVMQINEENHFIPIKIDFVNSFNSFYFSATSSQQTIY